MNSKAYFLNMDHFFIHPTAKVADCVRISENVFIGPYCVIGSGVFLGRDVRLLSHVVVEKNTTLSEGVCVSPFAVLGGDPQDLSYRGEETSLYVGPQSIIREHATLNRGTQAGGGLTHVGCSVMVMAGAHVAHDCHVGDRVVLANNATLAGHVIVGNDAVLGGGSAVHQFSRIGEGSMVSGMSGVTKDVLPYTTVRGVPASFCTLNRVRLSRMAVQHNEVIALKKFYDIVRNVDEDWGTSLDERLARIISEKGHILNFEKVRKSFDFIKAESKRSLCLL
jgi:UDP-N-acetylglucosamine acyltransferase